MKASEKIKRKIYNKIGVIVNKVGQNEAKFTDKLDTTVTEGVPELLREAGAEGTVLLRNNNVLPLKKDDVLSVFGRIQYDYMYVGYGSGGDVIKPYTVNLIEGLENSSINYNKELASVYENWCKKNPPDHGFWGHWPHYYEEMPIENNDIKKAAEKSTVAAVVIGRSAGEDRENYLTEGSYFLTEAEKSLIKRVSEAFEKTIIILNTGSIMDMSWEKEILKNNCAIMYVWQSGMESGNAVSDVLSGKKEPSGRLTDTIAENYFDYPCSDDFGEKEYNNYTEDIFVGYRYFETFAKDKVLYPFGFGLGYSEFNREFVKASLENDIASITVKATNISDYCGKDVLQIYASQPQGKLGKPAKVLCGFEKTNALKNGESQEITISIPLYAIASYDDSGKSGHKSCYVLENGEYSFYLGGNVRDCEKVWSFTLPETRVIEELKEASAPQYTFERMIAKEENGNVTYDFENVPTATEDLRKVILKNLPKDCGYTGNMGITLADVKNGKNTLDEFVSQLSPDELEAISRGDYTMDSALGAKGNAGVMGGVLPSLRKKGVEPLTTTDGPSGIRIGACCSLLPIGASIASMWNTALTQKVYEKIGEEMTVKGSDILLAPGMNIHRSPLCGRNFEYFSEDPFITGKTAAAVVKGVQKSGVSACPKHFACNNQETNRTKTDSRLSERALRDLS